MKKSLLKILIISIALLMTIGCASQGKAKNGKAGRNGRNGRNNRQIEDAQEDLRDLQDQLDDLEDQLKRNGQQGQNIIPPGIVNPGQVNPGDQLIPPGGVPGLTPSPSPTAGIPGAGGPDTSGSPLRAFQSVDQVFRFRAPASDTHGGVPTPSATATNDQPIVRRRVE